MREPGHLRIPPVPRAKKPNAIANDIKSLSWVGSLMPSSAPNMQRKIHKRYFLHHISWRAMVREKSLLMYWADKGHNAMIISAKMEKLFWIFSSLLFLGYEVATGAEERRRRFRTV
jgi:hypothetical protein